MSIIAVDQRAQVILLRRLDNLISLPAKINPQHCGLLFTGVVSRTSGMSAPTDSTLNHLRAGPARILTLDPSLRTRHSRQGARSMERRVLQICPPVGRGPPGLFTLVNELDTPTKATLTLFIQRQSDSCPVYCCATSFKSYLCSSISAVFLDSSSRCPNINICSAVQLSGSLLCNV